MSDTPQPAADPDVRRAYRWIVVRHVLLCVALGLMVAIAASSDVDDRWHWAAMAVLIVTMLFNYRCPCCRSWFGNSVFRTHCSACGTRLV